MSDEKRYTKAPNTNPDGLIDIPPGMIRKDDERLVGQSGVIASAIAKFFEPKAQPKSEEPDTDAAGESQLLEILYALVRYLCAKKGQAHADVGDCAKE